LYFLPFSDIERGARNPTILVLEKLAVALGVSAGRLLD
jgi:transcriptional regulator with XRE-family HTH domain